MARIPGFPASKANWLNRYAYRFSRRRYGKVAEPLTVAAHHPWISAGAALYELTLDKSRRVDGKLKALAALKAATLVGCPF